MNRTYNSQPCIGYLFSATCPENIRAEIFSILRVRPLKYDAANIQPPFISGETLWINDLCECGTMIGAESVQVELAEAASAPSLAEKSLDPEQRYKRYKQKGWSEAKIKRALGDFAKANTRSCSSDAELKAWSKVFEHLRDSNKIPWLGLFWHYYHGYIEDEQFTLTTQITPLDNALQLLPSLPQNTLLTICSPRRAGRYTR